MLRTIPVCWQDILDAHQIPVLDMDDAPFLRADTGTLTAPGLLEDHERDRLVAEGLLLRLPLKTHERAFKQRRDFAESLCDEELRWSVTDALAQPDPYQAFAEALAMVPLEAQRWTEQERIWDLEHLDRWLRSSGYEPDPPAVTSRKIIEFPRFRRES